MVLDKVKDAGTVFSKQVDKGIYYGVCYGNRLSVTYLYNRLRGRGGHTHTLDPTAVPGRVVGEVIGGAVGIAGGWRDIVTRKFMSHQQIQALQDELIDLKNNLGRYGEKAVKGLIDAITKEYERSKTLVNSHSSCILSQELQKPTINLEQKIDAMIAYITPEPIPGWREPYRNNGKRLFHIIGKELDAFHVRRKKAMAQGATTALNKGKHPKKPTPLGKDILEVVAKFMGP